MLRDFQNALVALAADERLRARFGTDGIAALRGFSLGERERAALSGIPFEALDRYARSLVSKRWDEVARVVPLARKIAPSLERRYRAWVAVSPAHALETVLAPGPAEALRALSALRTALANDEGEAPYAGDVLAYEVLAACARGDGQVRVLVSRFALGDIVQDLRRGLLPVDPEPIRHELRFTREEVRWRRA
jgi:hypothetical protein